MNEAIEALVRRHLGRKVVLRIKVPCRVPYKKAIYKGLYKVSIRGLLGLGRPFYEGAVLFR